MTRVVFALSPGLHLLDLAGPAQVFAGAADLGHGYRLDYVADTSEVTSAQGVTLRATTELPELSGDDLVMVPGWRSPVPDGPPRFGAALVEWIGDHHRHGGTVASICSGAFALGRMGLLDGRRCTTHHSLVGDLAARFPRATVVPDVLFVADDRVVTSAGIASGIDLALHLVASRHGPASAARVARSMVVYGRRNGDAPQHSVMLRHRKHLSDVVHRAQDLIDASFIRPLPLDRLAGAVGVSPRTLTRLFRDRIGTTPLRYQQALRLERAEYLIGQGSTVESAARAVGFADARMLRRLRGRTGRPGRDREAVEGSRRGDRSGGQGEDADRSSPLDGAERLSGGSDIAGTASSIRPRPAVARPGRPRRDRGRSRLAGFRGVPRGTRWPTTVHLAVRVIGRPGTTATFDQSDPYPGESERTGPADPRRPRRSVRRA